MKEIIKDGIKHIMTDEEYKKMKEFNLSEKITNEDPFVCLKVEDVKEFIKRCKKICCSVCEKEIDKLAGDDLK